jgi:hypothetical protein
VNTAAKVLPFDCADEVPVGLSDGLSDEVLVGLSDGVVPVGLSDEVVPVGLSSVV